MVRESVRGELEKLDGRRYGPESYLSSKTTDAKGRSGEE